MIEQASALTETLVSREDKYNGRFFQVHVDQITLPNGRPAMREVAEHAPGVGILALDDDNNVLVVTQYRYVFSKPLLEIPAGKLEADEDPALGGLRELREETGAEPEEFTSLGSILPSPGCFGERLYLYLARGLKMKDAQPDEDEFLIADRIPFDEMVRRIMDGEIEDAKTVTAVLKAKVLLCL